MFEINDKWWELPEMSAGQAQDYMDGIRNLNENISIVCSKNSCLTNEEIYENAVYNRRIENNLPFPPDKKRFVGALGLNDEFYRFTKK